MTTMAVTSSVPKNARISGEVCRFNDSQRAAALSRPDSESDRPNTLCNGGDLYLAYDLIGGKNGPPRSRRKCPCRRITNKKYAAPERALPLSRIIR